MTETGSFWARRRAAVQAEEAAEAMAQDAVPQPDVADKTDTEILEELGLSDPDMLTQGDDFAAFMSKSVPEHLRKRALRKLWLSNPVLACVDGLNDYDDDYLTGSYGNAPIKTAYQVGKGLMAHVLDVEKKNTPDVAVEEEVVEEPVLQVNEPEIVIAEHALEVEELEAEEEAVPHTPRRMQFQFDGDAA